MTVAISTLPKGIHIVRFVKALALAKGVTVEAVEIARDLWGTTAAPTRFLKAASSAGSTLPSGDWGSELADYTVAAQEFFGLVMARSIPGRMAGLRRLPLNVRLISQTGSATAAWVKQLEPKPVSEMTFADDQLTPLKIAALSVVTRDLLQLSSPAAEGWLRDALVNALVETLNVSFIDPGNAGTVDVEPAAISNGAPSVAATGTWTADLASLLALFTGDLETAYFVLNGNTERRPDRRCATEPQRPRRRTLRGAGDRRQVRAGRHDGARRRRADRLRRKPVAAGCRHPGIAADGHRTGRTGDVFAVAEKLRRLARRAGIKLAARQARRRGGADRGRVGGSMSGTVAELDAEIGELQQRYDRTFAAWRAIGRDGPAAEGRAFAETVKAMEKRLDVLRQERVAAIAGITIDEPVRSSDTQPLPPPPIVTKEAKPNWGGAFGKGLVKAIKGYVDRSLDDVHKRIDAIDALQKRVAELEGGGIRYFGTWQRAQSYRKGDVTTFEGSMFIALNATADTPGKGGDWQLCVKHGRDAR
jgi:Phage capsid family